MDFLGMQPRDVYVLVELSRADLKKLETALNMVELKFDGSNPEEKEASDYLTKKFYPKVKEMLENIEAEYGAAPDTQTE